MSPIVIVGTMDFHPEDASAAAELMRVMMIESNKESGCHHYAYSRDLATPNRFQLSELWETIAALDAHAKTQHMAVFRQGMSKLRVHGRSVKRYDTSNPQDL